LSNHPDSIIYWVTLNNVIEIGWAGLYRSPQMLSTIEVVFRPDDGSEKWHDDFLNHIRNLHGPAADMVENWDECCCSECRLAHVNSE
jgi:hypothetical protein